MCIDKYEIVLCNCIVVGISVARILGDLFVVARQLSLFGLVQSSFPRLL